MKTSRIFLLTACVMFMQYNSSATPTAQQAAKTIKECAASDLIGEDDILYTGPVPYRPGARWERKSPTLMLYAADVSDIFGRIPTGIYAEPPSVGATCSLSHTQKTNLAIDLGLNIAVLPLSANLKAKIDSNATVSATVEGFQWESVKTDAYNAALKALPESSAYKHPTPGHFTAISMLKVKGYSVTIDLSKTSNLGLQAGYSGPLPSKFAADIKGNASASVTSDGKLVLTIPGETYIAGIFRPINAQTGQTLSHGHISSAKPKWEVIAVDVDDRP